MTDSHYLVVLVEDEPELRELLSRQLDLVGCRVETAADGEEGLRKALGLKPNLVILDVSLPKLDGYTVCRKIREVNPRQPILILTSRAEELDVVTSFDCGADDYVSKPFRLAELLARIKSLLRRSDLQDSQSVGEIIRCGELEIDNRRRKILLAGAEIDLTSHEFDLVALLAANPGTVFSREQLLRTLWDDQSGVYLFSVNTMISRIRKKLEQDASKPRYILTARGVGYSFAEE